MRREGAGAPRKASPYRLMVAVRPCGTVTDRLLDGVRVLELAGDVAGPYGGKLLTDLSAEVMRYGTATQAFTNPRRGAPFRVSGNMQPECYRTGVGRLRDAGNRYPHR